MKADKKFRKKTDVHKMALPELYEKYGTHPDNVS